MAMSFFLGGASEEKRVTFLDKLKRIRNNLFSGSAFPKDIEAFNAEMENINAESMSLIDRSIKAYELRTKYADRSVMGKFFEKIIYSAIFAFSLPYVLLQKQPEQVSKGKMVYYKISENQGIVPGEIEEQDPQIVKMGTGLYFDAVARRILKKCILPSKLNLPFLFEVLFSLGNYAYMNAKYSPSIIVTSYEASPVASILTLYCKTNGIQHYNLMHGEKFYSHVNALGAFDVMYVWDDYYKLLFADLKYMCGEYRLFNPWRIMSLPEPTAQHDYTFYLNYVSKSILEKYIEVAIKLKGMGYRVYLRPHPSQLNEIKNNHLIPDGMLEDTKEVSIFQSLSNTKGVVSLYSTVLFQASFCGKEIIIDDLTDTEAYERLSGVRYIMLSKPHRKLSELFGVKTR